ncbi:MAG: SDR family oxidoreductase [Erysipelotrichaceae bacterium]
MKKVVLITGTSSGIGRATAMYYAERGYQVVATMRAPQLQTNALVHKNIVVDQLDVTSQDSIHACVERIKLQFGRIDVLVNNAGYGLLGVFEGATNEQIERQFATNVFGVMKLTREVLPLMRKQKSGVIITVSSVAGRIGFPLYSLYHASKFAIEGLMESLRYELAPFHIKVVLIEPGAIQTRFGLDSKVDTRVLDAYQAYVDRVSLRMQGISQRADAPEKVAKTIYQASITSNPKLRYPVGGGAPTLLTLKRWLPDCVIRYVIEEVTTREVKQTTVHTKKEAI